TVVDALAFLGGVRLLPTRSDVRWAVLLLGGLSWPVVDAIKLGQVGPILFLLSVIGWRWMDRPGRLGLAMALGVAIKIQPVLFLAWAVLTGRRRAAIVAVGALAVLAIAASVVVGWESWGDLLRVLADRTRAGSDTALVSPGQIAIDAGLGEAAASIVEIASWVLTGVVVLYLLARGSAVSSYMAVLIASQFVSPILWRHYALLLLVPVAWLLERRVWAAALVPLLSTVPLVLVTPPVAYPIEYVLALGLVAWEGVRHRREVA
ncbi:MAG TPA: glycosyltransferase family 87 protein, partial [Candidatus Acidoferrales bacterium]|nr:glycosyltransferase family 87 protein [Candidatus Acidoferrales bacterium]